MLMRRRGGGGDEDDYDRLFILVATFCKKRHFSVQEAA